MHTLFIIYVLGSSFTAGWYMQRLLMKYTLPQITMRDFFFLVLSCFFWIIVLPIEVIATFYQG